ncbi:cytochrome P450 [Teichococcus deserti]|uniref:cytochrome P450 n=1 Tax=Teichococcus deserti TaxID=1817963 RepID=UPI0010548536|nr:cytochrome P450 [Pseudoroseomonas deserti]
MTRPSMHRPGIDRPGGMPPRLDAGPARWCDRDRIWLLTRHADVAQLLRQPAVEAVEFYAGIAAIGRRAGRDYGSLVRLLAGILMFRNPPEHGAARDWLRRGLATLAGGFSAAAVGACVEVALAPLRHGRPVELVAALADRLPVLVMARALGFAEATVATLLAEGRGIVNAWERGLPLRAYDALQRQAAAIEAALLAELDRAARDGGPLQPLLALNQQGSRLSQAEVAGALFNLVMAGIETTAGLLSSAMLLAFGAPGRAAALRDGAIPLRGFLDEVLRCAPPLRRLPGRRLLAPARFGEIEIEAGAIVIADVEAAQHDPAVHPEPDLFDPARRRAPPLAFGGGAHACLGIPLAMLEAQLLLAALLEAGLRLEAAPPPRWEAHPSFRRLQQLQGRLDPSSPIPVPIAGTEHHVG